MNYKVIMTRKASRGAAKMPVGVQQKLALLLENLADTGPVQPMWPNYSKLSKTQYHCHLSHRWVACWRDTGVQLELEVYYAGSRGSAPY